MDLRELLVRLKETGGSDLHLAAGLRPAVRVGGELRMLHDVPAPTPDQVRDMVYPLLTQEEIRRFESDPDRRYELDVARGIADLGRFRFNLHRQRGSLAATIRMLPRAIPPLESLGLPAVVGDFPRCRRGLVLVAAPADDGVSTTLASMVDSINHTRPARIMTIEDSPEYVIDSDRAFVTQREVGDGADTLGFENALAHARRQDLDVLMIGRLTGYRTMSAALELADLGLLVLAGMPALTVTHAIIRLVESFPAELRPQAISQLSANLVGAVSQLTLPMTDRKGRVLACEVMKVNARVRSEIRRGHLEDLSSIIQADSSDTMISLDESLVDLARRQLIDYATARPHIREDETHRMIYQLTGGPKQGGPVPPDLERRAQQAAEFHTPAPSLTDTGVRRRLGSTVIPPWEKRE